MTSVELIEKAKALPPADGKRNTDRWMPIIDILRRKGWRFDAIWQFLKNEGENVHPNVRTFTSVVSRRYARMLAKEARK